MCRILLAAVAAFWSLAAGADVIDFVLDRSGDAAAAEHRASGAAGSAHGPWAFGGGAARWRGPWSAPERDVVRYGTDRRSLIAQLAGDDGRRFGAWTGYEAGKGRHRRAESKRGWFDNWLRAFGGALDSARRRFAAKPGRCGR